MGVATGHIVAKSEGRLDFLTLVLLIRRPIPVKAIWDFDWSKYLNFFSGLIIIRHKSSLK